MKTLLLLALGQDANVAEILRAYEGLAQELRELRTIAKRAVEDGEDRMKLQEELDRRIAEIDRKAGADRFLCGTRPAALPSNPNHTRAGTPWRRLAEAVRRLDEGNRTVTFTYSFIIPGTVMDKGPSVALKDHIDGGISSEEFKQEIREALAVWEDLFERVFSTAHGYGGNLQVIFADLGDETGTSFPSHPVTAPYPVPGRENIGDFRFGMEKLGTTASPHSPTGRAKDGEGDAGGDVHFDSGGDWRLDRQARRGRSSSITIVAVHEIGHGLALGHDEKSARSVMNPRVIVQGSFSTHFPDGLFFEGSSEAAAIATLYGTEAKRRGRNPIHVSGREVELPSLGAAALGISAIKVRTAHEAREAVRRLAEAVSRVDELRKKLGRSP